MRSRRMLATVASLISIVIALISPTLLVPSAVAQNAPGYRVETTRDGGLYAAIFTTPHGSIKVNFPDDMIIGDTVSGSIYTTPTGKNETERAQNLAELNSYVLEMQGQSTRVGDQTFSRTIDSSLNIVLLYRGQKVATTGMAVSLETPVSPTDFTIPTGGQQGRFIKITGPSNGVFSSQDSVKIGGQALPLLAESPRSLVVYNTNELLGPTTIELSENGATAQCPFRNIGIKLSAPKLSLIRGDKTSLEVIVFGLAGLTGTQSLELQNNTPGVITMSGGELQRLTISPKDVGPGGTYSTSRTLTGIMAGSFGVTGTVRWTDVQRIVSSSEILGYVWR